jgi:pimeloyl-ACP methyl ester carboxylesterase
MTSARAPAARGTIVFGHANGFPAGTYRVLFEAWRTAGWRVEAPEKFGHDPRYPVGANWPRLREQLLDFIDAVSPDAPVHLVGHSLGGYLGLLATCRRPQRVASLLLLDSPVLAGWRAHSVQVMKLTGLMRRVSPGRTSSRRRWQWPSRDAAHAHFAAKHAFARWDPRVLRDYIAAGTEPDADAQAQADAPGAVRLAFRREIETRIYDTLPHALGTLVHRHPPACRVGFIGGTQSTEVRQVGLAATRALTRGHISWLDGTHLFPMERPDDTAAAVLRWLDSAARR